jgi:hypothetical protein
VHFLSGYCRCADLWGLGECVGIAGLFCVRIRNIYFVGNFRRIAAPKMSFVVLRQALTMSINPLVTE